jgi:enoyl-CoA hydratase/3-hydroxyacyl-CoA dehydrogenase
MKKIGVIGAGNMGAGIAQKTAQEGLSVVLVDVKPEFVERGIRNIRTTLEQAVERKIFRREQVDEILSRIQTTVDLAETKECDLVIEAVFEDLAVKKALFSQLDKVCGPKTILATNTSSFSVDELARATDRPDRFVGLHFFYHPAMNRLLEIIPCTLTSSEVIETCKRYSILTGKTDILVKDSPGFAVNRFFAPLNNEATRILQEGWANIPTIDRAVMDALGIGMGPFKLVNVTGVPIAYHVSQSLYDQLGHPFYAPSARLKAQFESGKDFPLDGDVDEKGLGRVKDRLLSAVFYICCTLSEEDVVGMADIDLGAKVGLRWSKGPFELMNLAGIDNTYKMVEDLLKGWPDLKMPDSLRAQKDKGRPWDIRYVRYRRDGDLGRVYISRPDAMNALNPDVVRQLGEAFDEADSDQKTKAIVLERAGMAFVAGADIKFFVDCIKNDRLEDNQKFTSDGQAVLNRIDQSTKLVIGKMDGLALGGGLELALSADIIAATPKALMGFPETGIGIYPGLGGTQRTSRRLGKELAKYMIFTGRLIPAEAALSIGLVDHIFFPEEIDQKIRDLVNLGKRALSRDKGDTDLPPKFAQIKALFSDENIEGWLTGKYLQSDDPLNAEIAKTIAKKAPVALRFANQIVDEGYELPLSEGLKQELAHLNEVFSTADALVGLTSVGKRTPPVFQGK